MRRWLVTPLVAALVIVGACGDGSQSSGSKAETPLMIVAASSTRTVEAKSSRLSVVIEMKGVPQIPGGNFTVNSGGSFDYERHEGAMTMTLPPLRGVDFGRVDMVLVGTTVYQKFPPSFAAGLGSKLWMRVELGQLERLAGVQAGSLAQTSTSDPIQALDYLRGVADVVEVGKEQLRGEEVTRYRATVDLARATQNAPPERQAAVKSILQLVGVQTLPMDVWIDGEGRLRKSVHVMDLGKFNVPPEAAGGAKPSGTMTVTMELFDFGTSVEVTVPPADQVTDFAELMAKIRQDR